MLHRFTLLLGITGGLKVTREFELPDFDGMKDSNSFTMAHKEFFVPFDFIRECVCLNIVVDK